MIKDKEKNENKINSSFTGSLWVKVCLIGDRRLDRSEKRKLKLWIQSDSIMENAGENVE